MDEGFAALYRDQYRPMVRVAFLMTSDNAVAEELVQDAFVRVYRKLDRIDNPVAYLRRAVTNACRSHHRRRFLEKAHEPERPLPAGPPEIDVLWEQLQQLTPKRRVALVLRFYEDLKIDEIAEVMGCSPGTVKSLIHRGLASLRKVVEA
jgi:RNA polymerase sigma-70 factor (sigma-E family)